MFFFYPHTWLKKWLDAELVKIIFSQIFEDVALLLCTPLLWQFNAILIWDLLLGTYLLSHLPSLHFPFVPSIQTFLSDIFVGHSYRQWEHQWAWSSHWKLRPCSARSFVDVILWRGYNFCFHVLFFWSSCYLEVESPISVFYFFDLWLTGSYILLIWRGFSSFIILCSVCGFVFHGHLFCWCLSQVVTGTGAGICLSSLCVWNTESVSGFEE